MADISFFQLLYDGKIALIEDEVFNELSRVTWIIAGAEVLTYPPLPNVNEHCENDPAASCNAVPPLGTATSIPIYPVNSLVLIAGEGFNTLPYVTVTDFMNKSLAELKDPANTALLPSMIHV
jgi:hypothetical protein